MVDANSFSDGQAEIQPTSLLEMAQKVHDDFVANGKAKAEALESAAQLKHDELISNAKEFHDITILEAESEAATIIEDAQLSAFSLISDAKIKSDSIINGIQDKKLQLEAAVLKLQEFESTYRANLNALVSGAQATLAVAEIAVEDTETSESEENETTAIQGVNFAEVIESVVHADAGPVLLGAGRDVETSTDFSIDQTETNSDVESNETATPETEYETGETIEPTADVPDEDADSDEEDVESAEDEDNATDPDEVKPTFEENSSSESPVYYDPLATKPEIDAATVASILGQSGLETSEKEPTTFILGRPGWGKTTPLVKPSDNEDASVIINANPGPSRALDEIEEDLDSEVSSEKDEEEK
jgi:cell division septum initiation protein DivIVA